MSVVGITKSSYSEIHAKISTAIERGGGIDASAHGRVVIKVNLCDFRQPESGAVTHPIFLDAVLSYLRSLPERFQIFVVESDATVGRPDVLVRWLGIQPIIEKYDAKYVNLSKDKLVKQRIAGRYFDELHIPQVIADCEYFITMPKLKTHLLTDITCCLKNQYGCIPYRRKIRFHHALDDVIVDAARAMRPDFCIVDGILAMSGVKGPDLGIPIRSNVVVTGKDPVAVDSVCAEIMGFNPRSIGHVRKAEEAGIGKMSYTIEGEDISQVKRDFEFNHPYARILRTVMSMK
jgi:uncharacterized protein (DUF362 family)